MTITGLVGGIEKTSTVAIDGTISGNYCTGYAERGHRRSALRICRAPDAAAKSAWIISGPLKSSTRSPAFPRQGIFMVDLGEAVEPGSITLQWVRKAPLNLTVRCSC